MSSEIKNKIAKLDAAIKSPATPANMLGKLKETKASFEKELAALESANKQVPKVQPKTSKAKQQKVAKEKVVSKAKAKVSKVAAEAKTLLAKLRMSKEQKAFNEGRTKKELDKDAKREALPIGKRITDGSHYPYVKGNTYYEYRSNRADVSTKRKPYLEDGGEIENDYEVGELVKVKKYGWVMRVDKIEDDLFFLENDKRGTGNGNAGSYSKYELEKVYADGGRIPNNYIGKKERDIWEIWTTTQRKHFLEDHRDKYSDNDVLPKYTNDELAHLSFDELPTIVQSMVYEHRIDGQYAKGGEIEDEQSFHKGDKVKKKTTGEKAEVLNLNKGGNSLMESYSVITEDGKHCYWWATDMEVCYECGGRMMERGGYIKNQYQGKTAEQVWNEWTIAQRSHFLLDHVGRAKVESNRDKSFDELSEQIKLDLEFHVTEGQYAKGGIMANGGILPKSEFTIQEIKEHLINEFPDSFSFALYPLKRDTKHTPDYDAVKSYKGLMDSEIKGKLKFPQYKPTHSINYGISQGGENTYFEFLLETQQDYYVGTFGFKDEGDVPANYITKFLAFLQKSYGLPFEIIHEVMAKGGVTYNTGRSWHQDRAMHNKGEDWEKPLSERKELGGEIDKNNGLLNAVQNHVSSGYISSRLHDLGFKSLLYKETDKVRAKMIDILIENGDEKYSIENLNKLIKDASILALGKNDFNERVIKESGGEVYAKGGEMKWGGRVTFKEKVAAITESLNGRKVKPKYKKEYGSTYDKTEAHEAATKIVGAMVQKGKKEKGGELKKYRVNYRTSSKTKVVGGFEDVKATSIEDAIKKAKAKHNKEWYEGEAKGKEYTKNYVWKISN